jgi:CPA1 family monovalent cation:H+ antiporter
MHEGSVFLILFAVATAVAIAARWLKIPYTVALVLTGLAIGATHSLEAPHLTKELVFAVILPGLIFEAAFHLDLAKFWQDRVLIHSLAIPGLVLCVVLTAAMIAPFAAALDFARGFGLIHALVFAAVIVATDPIAVVALFKSLGAPRRLAVIVEGESLINDGTGVVLFTLVVAGVQAGGIDPGGAVVDFLLIAGVGALVGGVVGFAGAQLIRRIDDPMIELTLTVIVAYGSFSLAERVGASGVMATVVAGMLSGNYAARQGMSPTTRVAVETAWEYAAFVLNSLVFLLIGFEIDLPSILAAWQPILIAFVCVLLARAVVVFAVSLLLRRGSARLPWSWSGVVVWAGLRGALSMVLVLGLPVDFPHRALIVNMTFGVVLLSILLQGLSMAPLLRWLRIAGVRSAEQRRHESWRGRLRAANAALRELEQMRRERMTSAALLEQLQAQITAALHEAEEALHGLHLEASALRDEELRTARRRLLIAERDAVMQAAQKGLLGEDVQEELLADVDSRMEHLESGAVAHPVEAPPPAPVTPPAEGAPSPAAPRDVADDPPSRGPS